MKYKFSLPSRIRDFAVWHIEHYNEYKRDMERYKLDLIPSPTPSYSLTGGGGATASRTTENVAMRLVTAQHLAQMDTSIHAVEAALKAGDDIDRRLVELVYWRHEYTVTGAGMKLGLSCSGAYKRLNAILTRVALEMGYISL